MSPGTSRSSGRFGASASHFRLRSSLCYFLFRLQGSSSLPLEWSLLSIGTNLETNAPLDTRGTFGRHAARPHQPSPPGLSSGRKTHFPHRLPFALLRLRSSGSPMSRLGPHSPLQIQHRQSVQTVRLSTVPLPISTFGLPFTLQIDTSTTTHVPILDMS